MPVPGKVGMTVASHANRSGWLGMRRVSSTRLGRAREPRIVRMSAPNWVSMSATTRSFAVAVVPSTGHARGQQVEDPGDAAVVGPEVVTPVADAVGLVDHEQADPRRERREHRLPERCVREPLGRDEQDVDLVAVEAIGDVVPLVAVVAVDRHTRHAAALAGVDLVAHQGEERRDDARSVRRRGRAAGGWRRSRPRSCPSRCAARRGRACGRRRAPRWLRADRCGTWRPASSPTRARSRVPESRSLQSSHRRPYWRGATTVRASVDLGLHPAPHAGAHGCGGSP